MADLLPMRWRFSFPTFPPAGLRFQISLGILAILTVLFAVLGSAQILQQRQQLLTEWQRYGQTLAQQVAAVSSTPSSPIHTFNDPRLLQNLEDSIVANSGGLVRFCRISIWVGDHLRWVREIVPEGVYSLSIPSLSTPSTSTSTSDSPPNLPPVHALASSSTIETFQAEIWGIRVEGLPQSPTENIGHLQECRDPISGQTELEVSPEGWRLQPQECRRQGSQVWQKAGCREVPEALVPYQECRIVEGTVRIGLDRAYIDQKIQHTSLQLSLGWLVLLGILMLILHRFLDYLLVNPIIRLSQVTQAIASGIFTQTHLPMTHNEVGVLAQSLDQMSQQLQQRTTQLAMAVEQAEIARSTAEKANQAKSQFLSNMSHELRTPLNAMLGFTQLLSREGSLNRQQQQHLNIIRQSGEHLLTLINDVLEMSKIEAGRLFVEEGVCNLQALLTTLYEMSLLQATSKGISLIFEPDPLIPNQIYTDERKLRQVLTNLLGNAIKFTPTGSVRLSVSQQNTLAIHSDSGDQPMLYFAVMDTGLGIAESELQAVFEPFVQSASGRQSSEGTGLGLAISREFVRLLGGELRLISSLGQGSTFSFSIPLKLLKGSDYVSKKLQDTDRQSIQCHQSIIGIKPFLSNPKNLGGSPTLWRILVADDRWENCSLLSQLLTPIGFAVKTVQDGQAAFDCWQNWDPQVVIMDMRMPIMDGYSATRQIRAQATSHQPIIIAVTASAFAEQQAEILAAGCNDLLRKPLQIEQLLDKIAEYLQIEYIYQDLPADQGIPAAEISTPAEWQQDLEEMPHTWLERLRQAAQRVNQKAILSLIVEIPPSHVKLASRLINLTENYQFEEIIAYIERVLYN
ncbi:MAG: ATP-binding protein [Cyanobacteriota bacterium]|nr:ATP-binding protein [Cyanobacteriota bacterium]